MKNTTPDPTEPIGEVTIVDDFLPSPAELVPKKKTVRVTMKFTKESIELPYYRSIIRVSEKDKNS